MIEQGIVVRDEDIAILLQPDLSHEVWNDRKLQTRRVMKDQPGDEWSPASYEELSEPAGDGLDSDKVIGWGPVNEDGDEGYVCRYGHPGRRLWVRENVLLCVGSSGQGTQATATYACFVDGCQKFRESGEIYRDNRPFGSISNWPSWSKWTPSIHMPKWACRSVLEITAVRVERLQEITEAQALAEGLPSRDAFLERWDQINGRRGFTVASNPWVWVLDFKRVKPDG